MFYLRFQKAICTILFIAILFSLFLPFKDDDGEWTVMIAILPTLIGLLIVFLILTQQHIKKVAGILENHCDYELFCKKAKKIADSKYAFRSVRESFRLAKIEALFDGGQFKQANDEFEQLDLSYIVIVQHITYFIGYNNFLIKNHLRLNQLEEAQKAFATLEEYVERYKNRKRVSPVLISFLKLVEAEIDFYKKNYEKCTGLYQSIYESTDATTKLKVHAAYKLGIILMGNDNQKAKEYFEYAIQRGNKFYVAHEAQEQLKSLSLA